MCVIFIDHLDGAEKKEINSEKNEDFVMVMEVKLPQLGQTMEEATIVNYMVKVGDEVKKGDVIFEVETDKATLEVESPADGFVKYISADLGQTLPVGEAILVLGKKDEEVGADFIESLKGKAPADEAPAAARTTSAPPTPAAKPQPAKPAASAIAAAEIRLGATIPLTEKQKITAQKMFRSKHEIPCFYLTVKVDVTDLVEFRTKLNKTSDVEISYNDFIMRAVAIGMEKFPIMTGQLAGDTIRLAESINIGLAVSVPDGVVAPIVKDVNKKGLVRIARDSNALIEKAHNNKLSPTDLQGGCITVSNLGAFGIESNTAIVIPGQCSILGIGKITDTCMPDNSDFVIRKLMTMTLSVDHKVANGAYAAQFLDFVRKLLEDTSTFA